MIWYFYQCFFFFTFWTWYWANSNPWQFLNKDDIKRILSFKDCVDNQVVFLHVLWKNFNVFNNHDSLPFTVEQIDCLLLSQSFWYFLECHFLLNWCCQKEHRFRSDWWSPLQFEHLKEWRHGFLFFVSNLGELVFSLVLRQQANWRWCSNLCGPLHFMHLAPLILHTLVTYLHFQQFLHWETSRFIFASWIVVI